jgi:phosphoglycolate phosphatase
MKKYNYIFFDFDGTLVNTVEGTRKSAEYALAHFEIIETKKDLGKIFCGPPLKQSFEKFGLHDEQVNKAIELYRKYQSENTIEINMLYKGIDNLLKNLKQLNKTLVVVTAKYEETAIKIFKTFGYL